MTNVSRTASDAATVSEEQQVAAAGLADIERAGDVRDRAIENLHRIVLSSHGGGSQKPQANGDYASDAISFIATFVWLHNISVQAPKLYSFLKVMASLAIDIPVFATLICGFRSP